MLHVGDGMGWWMVWAGPMMVIFWGALIALIVWAVQALTRRETGQGQTREPGTRPGTPLDIAKERYARGDISREEFQQIRNDLEAS